MSKLFGFSIDNSDELKQSKNLLSPVPPNDDDGVDSFVTAGFYANSQYLDIEGVYKTEADLLRRYREMALHPECDNAIEDIVNEAIVSDLYDSPVEIELSNLNATDALKKKIREEFRNIKEMLDFDRKSHEIFRNWYVDGQLYYIKVIDVKDPSKGILDLRYIDPAKIKLIRREKKETSRTPYAGNQIQSVGAEFGRNDSLNSFYPEIEEFFVYNPNPQSAGAIGGFQKSQKIIKIARDSVAYVNSGLYDRNKGNVLSYLNKAIKSLNQLRMIEDSLVIYRLSRAPERRIFYIDVGNLPKVKAEQYLKEVMSRYRNKLVYDANTGEVRDDRKFMSMMEDFWLPRREGGRGTEITSLPGGQNLGELSDIEYFQKKLYGSLGVPESRISSEGGFNLGKSSEIQRDELKFAKWVGRLRKKFAHIFNDILRTQLILKNVIVPEDWEQLSDHIQYDFIYDNQFAELKNSELMTERLGLLASIEPYIGKYYSQDYIRRKILRQTDSEIVEIDEQIKKEIKMGIIPDPATIDPITGEPLPPMDENGQPIQEMPPEELPPPGPDANDLKRGEI